MAAAATPSPRFTPLRIVIVAWLGLKVLVTICGFGAKLMGIGAAAVNGPVQFNVTAGFALAILGGLDVALGCLNVILIVAVIYSLIKNRSGFTRQGCLIPLAAVAVWLLVKFALFVAGTLIGLTALKGPGVEMVFSCLDGIAWAGLLGVILWTLTRRP